MQVDWHPDAAADYEEAYAWHAEHGIPYGLRFIASIDRAIQRIADHPERYPHHVHGTRRFVVPKTPYVIVFRVKTDRIWIITLHHARRDPTRWHARA